MAEEQRRYTAPKRIMVLPQDLNYLSIPNHLNKTIRRRLDKDEKMGKYYLENEARAIQEANSDGEKKIIKEQTEQLKNDMKKYGTVRYSFLTDETTKELKNLPKDDPLFREERNLYNILHNSENFEKPKENTSCMGGNCVILRRGGYAPLRKMNNNKSFMK